MIEVKKLGYSIAAAASTLALTAGSAFAQPADGISADTLDVKTSVGPVSTLNEGIVFILNLFVYLGWIGVIIGVGLAVFGLVYKLINTDSEEAMKTVQGYLTKAVLIVVAGILLIGSGFIVKTVGALFGLTTTISDTVPTGTEE